MAKRKYRQSKASRSAAAKKGWRKRRSSGFGKRTASKKAHRGGKGHAARVRAGKASWRKFVAKHGGSVKRAKAALKRRLHG